MEAVTKRQSQLYVLEFPAFSSFWNEKQEAQESAAPTGVTRSLRKATASPRDRRAVSGLGVRRGPSHQGREEGC